MTSVTSQENKTRVDKGIIKKYTLRPVPVLLPERLYSFGARSQRVSPEIRPVKVLPALYVWQKPESFNYRLHEAGILAPSVDGN